MIPGRATNRDIFAFDVWVEHNVAQPVDDGYRAVVPEPAREGVHNLTTNLHEPIVLANDVLQGEGRQAIRTPGADRDQFHGRAGRADRRGRARSASPITTMISASPWARAASQEGSYLVLPFVGPLPPRDLVGQRRGRGFRSPLLCPLPRQGHLAVRPRRACGSWTRWTSAGTSSTASSAARSTSMPPPAISTARAETPASGARIPGDPAAGPLTRPGHVTEYQNRVKGLAFGAPSPYIPPCMSMGLAHCLFCQRIQWDGPEDALRGSGPHAR